MKTDGPNNEADERLRPPVLAGDVQDAIEAAESGDTTPLGRLVESCRGYLLMMAHRRLDPQLRVKLAASDLVQETMLAAQKNVHQFRGQSEGEFLAWLKQILSHHLTDARRTYHEAEKRQLARERNLQGDTQSGERPVDVADDNATPGTHSVLREQADALKQALDRLPDDFRRAVRLRNWDRLSFEEIGRKMNRTAEAARKLWSRAVDRLRIELGANDESC